MTQMKGITPIIAILVLLLITVAIAGAAWVYISSYYGGMTKQQIEVTSADCTTTGTTVYIRNIGTDPVNISSDVFISREFVVAGSANTSLVNYTYVSASASTPNDGMVGPNQVGQYKDYICTSATDAVCRYTLIAAGRVTKVQATC